MIQRIIHKSTDNHDLILIFLGWGTDAQAISTLRYPSCDIMAVWDYRDPSFDTSHIQRYRNIYLFAWSMGVMMAERVLCGHPDIRPTLSIAVNGSPYPIDDLRGIPYAIFTGTLDGLDESSLQKFRRRMCRNKEEYAGYRDVQPDRPIDELRDELRILGMLAKENHTIHSTTLKWDRAIIAGNDRIFPADNLRRAWDTLSTRIRITEDGHLPDWQTIINQEIIDKDYVARKFMRSLPTYDNEAVAQKAIAGHLWDMWRNELASRSPQSIIEAGFGTGTMTRLYMSQLKPSHLILWDLCPSDIEFTCTSVETLTGDAEEFMSRQPDTSVDAIVSASTIQWFNSPSGFISNAARALSSGGHLVISTFGERNMQELTQVTNLPLRYLTLNELVGLLPANMRLLAAVQEDITLRFDSPKEVMRHLRATGVNGMRGTDTPLSRILSGYPRNHDGSVNLTYHPLYLIAEKT